MTFHSVGNVIIPTDKLIFFRGVGIPPTIYIYIYIYIFSLANNNDLTVLPRWNHG